MIIDSVGMWMVLLVVGGGNIRISEITLSFGDKGLVGISCSNHFMVFVTASELRVSKLRSLFKNWSISIFMLPGSLITDCDCV